MSDLSQITIDSFASTLNELISANVHSRGKGNAFKKWCTDNFELDSRIAYIKSQQQLTNRVSEQFRYFSPIVVFVCNPDVKRDTLLKYIFERGYKQLKAIAIVGVSISGEGKTAKATFEYEQLLVYRKCNLASWAEDVFAKSDNAYTLMEQNGTSVDQDSDALQVIYYGTPGSGKSHKVSKIVGETPYRTIFHPDSDYASFVGSYKPVGDEIDGIGYKFVSQVFTDAYIAAWKNPDEDITLVIEEINRGNCAQIFGDLFQLLDRKNGYSEYPVTPNADLRRHLAKEFAFSEDSFVSRDYNDELEKKILKGEVMVMPNNMRIYATMNTSDQSLFPMDSAFKRRWGWEYVPVCYDEETEDEEYNRAMDYTININDDYSPLWLDFLKGVNVIIKDTTFSEDKQMGNYFIKSSIDARGFVNKVMFYLWSEICKEEYKTDKNFFRYENESGEIIEFSFNDLFPINDKTKAVLKSFIERMIAIGNK